MALFIRAPYKYLPTTGVPVHDGSQKDVFEEQKTMAAKITLLLVLPLLLFQGAVSNGGQATAYEVPEAYEVYSAILTSEWPVRVQHAKSLIIQTETQNYQMCLRPEKEWQEKLGPAISDFVRLNAKPWLLQRRIDSETPYELVAAADLRSTMQAGWEGFYQRYPNSGGWVEVSAVGFNNDRTVAVVYMGHHCGGLCGGGCFHVLEKKDGKWVPLEWRGSSSAWAS